MQDRIVIGGSVTLSNNISGDCSLTNMLNGELGVFTAVYPDAYTGVLEVTPSAETQVLQTAHLTMPSNVVINPIPNNYGLITYNGSFLTVS